jgi:hypothetical protein
LRSYERDFEKLTRGFKGDSVFRNRDTASQNHVTVPTPGDIFSKSLDCFKKNAAASQNLSPAIPNPGDSFPKLRFRLFKTPATAFQKPSAAFQNPGDSFSKPRRRLFKTPVTAFQNPGDSLSKSLDSFEKPAAASQNLSPAFPKAKQTGLINCFCLYLCVLLCTDFYRLTILNLFPPIPQIQQKLAEFEGEREVRLISFSSVSMYSSIH